MDNDKLQNSSSITNDKLPRYIQVNSTLEFSRLVCALERAPRGLALSADQEGAEPGLGAEDRHLWWKSRSRVLHGQAHHQADSLRGRRRQP